jgi:hypothetical protein
MGVAVSEAASSAPVSATDVSSWELSASAPVSVEELSSAVLSTAPVSGETSPEPAEPVSVVPSSGPSLPLSEQAVSRASSVIANEHFIRIGVPLQAVEF